MAAQAQELPREGNRFKDSAVPSWQRWQVGKQRAREKKEKKVNSTCLWNAQSTWVFRIKYIRTIYKSDSSCCSLFCCWLREHAAQNLWVMSACVRLTCVWIETYKGIKQRKIWEISVSERTLASSSDMWIIQFLVNTHTWREAWAFLPSILLELGITYTGKLKNMIFSILCLYLRSLTLSVSLLSFHISSPALSLLYSVSY